SLEIADERAWTVGIRKGFVSTTPLSGAPGDLRRFTVVPLPVDARLPSTIGMHSEHGRVWVASGVERPAIALDATSVAGDPPATAGSSLPNFKAIGGNAQDLYGVTLDGRVARLSPAGDVEWDSRLPDSPKVSKVVAEGSGVWLLAQDRILRVDTETEKVIELDIDAVDIAVGDGLLWVVGQHHVHVYDSATARSLSSVDIETELLGVDYLARSGWVLGKGGKIFRVSMDEEPLKLTQPLQDDRLVYAYSADGDLWAEQADGDDVNLVVSPAEDRRPSISPDGKTIAFQRGRDTSGGVYFLDLSNGEERFLGHGGWPTYGHGDAFAFVSRGRGVFGINFVNGRDSQFVATDENPANLTWAPDDSALYFVAGPTSRRVPYRITFGSSAGAGAPLTLAPGNTPAGAIYPVAAISDGGRLYAVRACCRLPRAEVIYEFGYIDLMNPSRPFVPQVELTESSINEPISLVDVHGLIPPSLGNPQRWIEGPREGSVDDSAWLLSDGATFIYLFRDGAAWSFSDERLEHPGRATFDGFARGLGRELSRPGLDAPLTSDVPTWR
ncbi:MAG: hypothetical protein QOK47_375, partial [Actinomycetota bacterium]|nr:hypothetical protein [Actinomycetota bacterium]